MRIGINTLFYIPGEVGGSETYLRRTLTAMATRIADDVLLVFTNRENDPVLRRDLADFPLVGFCNLPFRAIRRTVRIVREQTELPVLAKRFGIDVLWSPGYTSPLLCHCPQVTTLLDMQYKHHPDDFSLPARLTTDFLVNAGARISRHLLTISQFSKREIVVHTGVPPEKVHATLLAADPRFAAMEKTDAVSRLSATDVFAKRPYILSVANSYPHKNLHTLVAAFGKIKDRIPHHLVLVGLPRRGESMLEDAMAEVSDRSRIIRLAQLSTQQLAAVYTAADLFVFPSLYEGFGLPILEAMIAGTPVVSTKMGSIPEVGGDRIVYADPPTADNLSICMRRVLQWPEDQRSVWVQNAKTRAAEFSWQRTADQTLDVLRKAAEQN